MTLFIVYVVVGIAIFWGTFRLMIIELDNAQTVLYKLALNIISIGKAYQDARLDIRQRSYMIEDMTEWREVGRQMIRLNRG